MKIKHIETITLDIPFYADHVTRAMQRAQTHDERVHVCRIETDNGIVGYGDGGVADVDRLMGQNPFAIMNDDSIGFGAQLAVLDVAGKSAGVPVHALLGDKLRDRCPISWWDIDMPPEDWAAEAQESLKRGYTCIKLKARPWRDIIDQIETVGKVVPLDYKFDVDFNGFLLTQAKAEVILQQLDDHPNIGMYESPFYLQQDLTGARILRERVRKTVVEHFREECLHAHCSDGFVIGGGATQTRRDGTLAAAFNKPFWLQLVGTGITTAFAVHLGSVLSHAQLPYITCFELWEHNLLQERLEVVDGYIAVPDAPGLGVEVDEGAIEKYKVDKNQPSPTALYKQKKRILRISWPGVGEKRRIWEFTDEAIYQRAFYQGNLPGFERGVNLEVIEDDGSPGFQRVHERLVARGL
ncbi:MAG: mandelate racemase/muconate lactonizing enzyme family protein [bacterium]|nr:mandelate racemase/muconate lactonizing enzyme family protein [bacterium]